MCQFLSLLWHLLSSHSLFSSMSVIPTFEYISAECESGSLCLIQQGEKSCYNHLFFVCRPLRNMRNLIHVNLCISLGIAQLIFVIGVSRSDPTSQTVPVHCQIIAVLLHYFFLVSFMWMLMEGAVLYIILVKVFITNEKYYVLAFIFISYGVPALYMGLLTLPLGFALPSQPNYGYRKA